MKYLELNENVIMNFEANNIQTSPDPGTLISWHYTNAQAIYILYFQALV